MSTGDSSPEPRCNVSRPQARYRTHPDSPAAATACGIIRLQASQHCGIYSLARRMLITSSEVMTPVSLL